MLFRDSRYLFLTNYCGTYTQEIDELMNIMRNLLKRVSQFCLLLMLNEIMSVADRCTVLWKGKCIGTVDIKDTTKEELSRMMVGRDVTFKVEKKEKEPGEVVLSVKNISCAFSTS